jgi:HPt (histidine-containing phosphotransfer) domain-containing protein
MAVNDHAPSHRLLADMLHKTQEVFDREATLARVEGDVELLQELVALFCTDCPTLLATLCHALTHGDASTLARTAHSLKGAARSLGVSRVAAVAQHLEHLGQEGRLNEAAATYAILEDEALRCLEVLAELVVHD